MRISLSLLAATALTLLGAALLPRPGQAVMLGFAPGVSPAPVFGAADWTVLGLRSLGPLTLVRAKPGDDRADAFALRRATGASFIILAAPRPDCAPGPGAFARP